MDAIAQGLADDLERMSDGLDTLIGEREYLYREDRSSGFPWHAFYVMPSLLLLDDSLSAVDAKRRNRPLLEFHSKRATRKDNLDSLSPSLSCPSGRLDPCV